MKHSLQITIFLVMLFILSQLAGLTLLKLSVTDVTANAETGAIEVNYEDTAIGERPQTEGFGSFLYIVLGVLFATVILLIIMKFGKMLLWKIWYFIAVVLTTTVAVGVFLQPWIAFVMGALLAILKIWKPNVITHNLSEILIYSGIAILLAPLFDVFWASMLLIAIALYDAYAVWHSKHMVKMAQFQTKSNIFAGLYIPYGKSSMKSVKKADKDVPAPPQAKAKSAILGGGDIAFPLIFSGAVFTWLVKKSYGLQEALLFSFIVTLIATISLTVLFVLAKKDKYYPAMPFLSSGCLLGFGIVYLFTL